LKNSETQNLDRREAGKSAASPEWNSTAADARRGLARRTKQCNGLWARAQYGTGLRLSKPVRLRIKDVDLDRGTVTVRQGKGDIYLHVATGANGLRATSPLDSLDPPVAKPCGVAA